MLLKEEDEALDPRVKRTRQLLMDALDSLLAKKDLQAITVAEITAVAEVNRATFYAHYVDKYALFGHLVRQTFEDALRQRLRESDEGFCMDELQTLILAVFEYMAQFDGHCHPGDLQTRQLVVQQLQTQLQTMILNGMAQVDFDDVDHDRELGASVMSWAIFGAAFQWSRSKKRLPLETAAEQVMQFISQGIAPVAESLRQANETVRAR